MGDFTPEQVELMRKHNIKPDNYRLLLDTKSKLVLLHRRGSRRTLKKEVLNNDA